MESKLLVICDPEEKYAQALALYIMNRRGIHFQVHICNELKYVREADLLLISDIYSEDERDSVPAKSRIVLAATPVEACLEGSIYKYQKGEQILDEILEKCEEMYAKKELYSASSQRKNREIIGVFSPIHRIGKTAYALQLGERMAVSENVLYLNFELYGGVGGHFEKGGQTMSDVLYYARQETGNLGYMITKLVKQRGSLDYILPVTVSEDIRSLRAEELREVIRQITDCSIYETIILDIDEGIRDLYELLELCSQIHLLSDGSPYSKAKLEQFERELMLLGYENILGKIVRKEFVS